MDMFEQQFEEGRQKEAPLAARMRPTSFDEFVGQEHLIGRGHVLRRAIESGKLPSIVLWGPPGSRRVHCIRLEPRLIRLSSPKDGLVSRRSAVYTTGSS